MNSIQQNKLDKELVKRIVKPVTDEFSPEEFVLVDSLVDDYFSNNALSLSSPSQNSNIPLALASSSDLILAIAIPTAVEVIKKVIDEFADIAHKKIEANSNIVQKHDKATRGNLSVKVNVEGISITINIKLANHATNKRTINKLVQRLTEQAVKELRAAHVI